MNALISKLKEKAFSDKDIIKLCKKKVRIIKYPELSKFKNIMTALGPHKALIILYEIEKNYGHWVSLFQNSKGNIEFFDPYGLKPDDELKFISKNFRKINNEKYPHLTALLLNSDKPIEYNETRLQQYKEDVNTCGRWCGLRILFRNMLLKDFIKLFKKNKKYSPDFLATSLTLFI